MSAPDYVYTPWSEERRKRASEAAKRRARPIFIVARQGVRAGQIEPLPAWLSAHKCTRGTEVGIKATYRTREEAHADAMKLERHVNDPCCLYYAARVDEHAA